MQGTCQSCNKETEVAPTIIGEADGDKTLKSLNLCAECAKAQGGTQPSA